MGIGSLIGGVVNVLGGVAGGQAANESTQASAQAQLDIDRLNREFQGEMFEEQLQQQRPYMELGRMAAPRLGAMINDPSSFDASEIPSYQFQDESLQQMMGEKFGSPSLGIMGNLRNRLGVQERESTKNRLFDLMKIGTGASETAGRSGSVTANALSNAMMQSAGIRGNLQSQLYNQQQSNVNQAVQGVGGIPAYMAYQNYANPRDPNSQYGNWRGV
jgi:hypothetical protein